MILDRDLSAVHLHRLFRDRQAEPGSPMVAGAGLVEANKSIGNPLAILSRDLRGLVGDLEPPAVQLTLYLGIWLILGSGA
ncbi:MAG: hypothetical protein JWL71_4286 [Acidobacteria bacterium]|nr:hypothetical protein [Acidobacteriota bacterium]